MLPKNLSAFEIAPLFPEQVFSVSNPLLGALCNPKFSLRAQFRLLTLRLPFSKGPGNANFMDPVGKRKF